MLQDLMIVVDPLTKDHPVTKRPIKKIELKIAIVIKT